MPIEECTLDDCRQLALMNKQLIEDEKHDNPMNAEQLEQRMKGFLEGEYRAYFYKIHEDIVGYALVKTSVVPTYLRQFFICHEYRRKGYGKAFFTELIKILVDKAIDIEVLSWNEAGIQFWQSLGFSPRSIYMRYQKEV